MSTHALSWAWRQEVGDAGAKLVLLKLADQANDRGECWPSHRTLAAECEMGRRTVQRKLEILYAAGLVSAEPRTRASGGDSSLLYRVGVRTVEGEQTSATVRQSDAPPCVTDDAPPAPLVTHHEPPEEPTSTPDGVEGAAPAAHPPDEIWEILEEQFGRVAPRTNAYARRNKATADLRRLGALPEQVRSAIAAWPRRFPGATLTDIALATHFPQLAADAQPRREAPSLSAVERVAHRLREAQAAVKITTARSACPHCGVGGGHHVEDCPAPRETIVQAYRRFVTEAATDTGFPLVDLEQVIRSWDDLDDVERQELVDHAEHVRSTTTTEEGCRLMAGPDPEGSSRDELRLGPDRQVRPGSRLASDAHRDGRGNGPAGSLLPRPGR